MHGRAVAIFLLLGVALAGVPWVVPQVALAGHAWPVSNANHIANIHWQSVNHGFYDEDACYDSYTTSITDATFKTYLQDALWATGSWDLPLGNANLDIWTTTYDCANYDLSLIELKYLVQDSGACGGFSCQTSWAYPVYQNGVLKHWNLSEVIFKTAHLTGTAASRRAVINHESGHMFGLKDPQDPIRNAQGTVTTSYCEADGWWFGSSVMHQYEVYGCPAGTIQYPVYDKETVVNTVMPSH